VAAAEKPPDGNLLKLLFTFLTIISILQIYKLWVYWRIERQTNHGEPAV
jgi:hypothetical protein